MKKHVLLVLLSLLLIGCGTDNSSSSLSENTSNEQTSQNQITSENESSISEIDPSFGYSEETISSNTSINESSSDSSNSEDGVNYYTLSGVVSDQNNDKVSNVTMNIRNQDGSIDLNDNTDENGLFEFTNLVEGTYTLTVLFLPSDIYDYTSGSITIDISGDDLEISYNSIVLHKDSISWGGIH